MQVADYMHTTPITVPPEETMRRASERMWSNNIRHLPVVNATGKLVGILTDRDIRQASASNEPHLATYEWTALLEKLTVQEVMTRQVTTVRRHTPVTEAAQLLVEKKFGCLPVVRDENTLEGIITVTDLLRAYVAQNEKNQPILLSRWAESAQAE
jgi:acetoin utilization protein AcuB